MDYSELSEMEFGQIRNLDLFKFLGKSYVSPRKVKRFRDLVVDESKMKLKTGDDIHIVKLGNRWNLSWDWSSYISYFYNNKWNKKESREWTMDEKAVYARKAIDSKCGARILYRYSTYNSGFKNYHGRVLIITGKYAGKIVSIRL